MRRPITRWLNDRNLLGRYEWWASGAICDVLGYRFGKRSSRRIPPLEELVSVELKMVDVMGVIQQAKNNRRHSRFSYAAMPLHRVERMMQATVDRFAKAGVGLLSVDHCHEVAEVVPPAENEISRHVNQIKLERSLWRKHRRDGGVTIKK